MKNKKLEIIKPANLMSELIMLTVDKFRYDSTKIWISTKITPRIDNTEMGIWKLRTISGLDSPIWAKEMWLPFIAMREDTGNLGPLGRLSFETALILEWTVVGILILNLLF